jgi:hypothetical protein
VVEVVELIGGSLKWVGIDEVGIVILVDFLLIDEAYLEV